MRIVCPSCESAYEVPSSILATRRTVRCAHCHADWSPGEAEAMEAPAIVATQVEARQAFEAPVISPVEIERPPSPGLESLLLPAVDAEPRAGLPRRAVAVVASWVVSFAMLGAVGWSLITWRTAVMHAWPASARVYAALGYLS